MSVYRIPVRVTASRRDSVPVEIPDGLTEEAVQNMIDGAVDRYYDTLDAGDLAADLDVSPQSAARHIGYTFGGAQ